MTNDEQNNSLEKELQSLDERLTSLYDARLDEMDEEDKKALHPILRALRSEQARYKDSGLIAKGGEKSVSKVYDRRLKRSVAMAKPLREGNDPLQEKLLREAQLGANLDHPYIVPVYDVGIDASDSPFFTMKLIPGDSLRHVIEQLRNGNDIYLKDYPPETLLGIYQKVCDAIAYAHSRGVLHLDIKPDNIRLGKYGAVFVCDWGLADIVLQSDSDLHEEPAEYLDGNLLNDTVQYGTIRGTPGFMAPEQTDPQSIRTEQTDVYAMGALLYCLLTRELPVEGDSGEERIENTREGRVIPPGTRRKIANIPRSLAAVAMKALALNPEDRYASVEEISREITRYLTGHPTEAERAGVLSSFSFLVKRHNRIASLALFSLTAIAVVISLSLGAVNRQKAEAVEARETAEKNFRLYREQQWQSLELSADLMDFTVFALKTRDYSRANQKIRVLSAALGQTSKPALKKELLLEKGAMHFVLQQFQKASECFTGIEDVPTREYQDLIRLTEKYLRVKPNDQSLLTPELLTALIREADYGNRTIYYLYFHYMKRADKIPPPQYLHLAIAVLDKLNRAYSTKNNPPMVLEKRKEGWHLDLRSAPYTHYSLIAINRHWKNVLEPFGLYSLDISGLPFRSLVELQTLQITELTMIDVPINRPYGLPKQIELMGVQKLFIDTETYPDEVINKLREICTVIDIASQK
jgi:serine/threonine protein kinase